MDDTTTATRTGGSFWLGRGGMKDARTARRQASRVRPGRISPWREVPESIERPAYVEHGDEVGEDPMIKSGELAQRMRVAGRTAAEVLNVVGAAVRPGITTDELDAIGHQAMLERGAYPSTLGYHGFNKSLCTSVNEVICHGIPDSRPLEDGDVVNIDVSTYIDGCHGDNSRMFLAGDVDDESRRLVDTTREALGAGIAMCGPGVPVPEIGRAIQRVADRERLGVVRAFVGHGIGTHFHNDPQVHHYATKGNSPRMQKGWCFTIEPMLTLGTWKHRMWDDGWTAVTTDLSRSAQFEHQLLVTDDGVDIITLAADTPEPDRHGR